MEALSFLRSSYTMAQQEQEEKDEMMNICVMVIKTVSLPIYKCDTAGDLKDILVLQHKEIPADVNQDMFFNGNHLKNDQTLFDYGVRSNSTVISYIGNSKFLSLIIEVPSRQTTFIIEAKPEDTVKNVKAVIEDTEKMGSDEFNLVHRGSVLAEKKTLEFLGIINGSSLYVVLKPRVLQVSVKTMCGRTVKIQVKESYTILDVKSLVHSIIGYSVGGFSYDGIKLDDSKMVSYYEIKDNSILYYSGFVFEFPYLVDGKRMCNNRLP